MHGHHLPQQCILFGTIQQSWQGQSRCGPGCRNHTKSHSPQRGDRPGLYRRAHVTNHSIAQQIRDDTTGHDHHRPGTAKTSKPCREYGQSKLSFAGSGRTCYQPRLTVLGDAVQQFVWVPLRSHTFKISPRGNKRKICTGIFNWPVFLTVFSITQVGELYQ